MIAIRPTERADLKKLLEIRSNKLVQDFHVDDPPSNHELIESLFINNRSDHHLYCWHTVLVSNELVGYIATQSLFDQTRIAHYLGFNLSPDFWNKGGMTNALTQRIDQLFDERADAVIMAHTLNVNVSCIRLLEKLNFKEDDVTWFDRLIRRFSNKNKSWKIKYRLTCENWITT